LSNAIRIAHFGVLRRADFERIGWRRALLRSAVGIAVDCVIMVDDARLASAFPREIVQAMPFERFVPFGSLLLSGHSPRVAVWLAALWWLAELATMLFHPRRRGHLALCGGPRWVARERALAPRTIEGHACLRDDPFDDSCGRFDSVDQIDALARPQNRRIVLIRTRRRRIALPLR
jgi:hypothetical protein